MKKDKEIFLVIDLLRVTKVILILIVVSFALLFILSSSAKPDMGFVYKLKRLQEDSYLKLQPNPRSQLISYNKILDERLEELRYLISLGETNLVPSSSLRYSTTAGRITEILINNDLPTEKAYFINKFNQQEKALNLLLQAYSQAHTMEDWKFLQDGINYLNIYKSKLSTN